IDHITEFEILCAQVAWPEETKASLFLETLLPGLKSSIRRSDVDLDCYDKVKQKAQRLEREFQESKKQRPTRKSDTYSTAGNGSIIPTRTFSNKQANNEIRTTDMGARSEQQKKGLCYNCEEPGHISKDCPKPRRPRTQLSTQIAAVELPNQEENWENGRAH
ncbi:hypothetical protein V1505DRAFT_153970, partial [Lipomyces doorenjongii]